MVGDRSDRPMLSRPEIRRLLDERGLRPSRALGQNFVTDPNTVRRIARLAGVGPKSRVVEVGAGVGSLTLALARTGASVTAVEVDRGLIPVLESVLHGTGVKIVHADAMQVDWSEILGHGDGGGASGDEGDAVDAAWSLVANLPYNIATPLIADLLDGVPEIGKMTVMVQREVGERLVARPGEDAYGAVSVKVAYHSEAALLARVPASVFIPRPNVESVVVGIERREEPAVDPGTVSRERLFRVVGAGFSQRRKMLRRSLSGIVEESAFEAAGIDPTSRAEDLGVDDWGRLASTPLLGSGGGVLG